MATVETIIFVEDLLKLKGTKRILSDVIEKELRKIRHADFELIKREGDFYFYKEKNTGDIYKAGDVNDIDIEETIRNNLWIVGIPAIGTRRPGHANYLIRENRNPQFFANNIKNFTDEQSKGLEELWKVVIEYCMITGIPLNIQRDNLWWDGEKWLIYDTYPLFDRMFQFTLNLKNGKEYINKLLNPRDVKETWNVTYAKRNGDILGIFPFEKDAFYVPIKEKKVEYPTEKIKLHVNAMKMLQEKDYPEYGVFYSRFVQMNEEVSDLIRSDIKLSKAICSELPDCDNTRIIKEEIDTILELKKETEEYHKTLKKEDINVLRRYTEDKYITMNKCLREGTYTLDCDNETKYDIITMEKLIENGPRIKKDITVYRGIDPSDNESKKVSEALSKLSPGDFWEDRGFVSTSSQHPPKSFIGKTCCIFQILLKAGTPAYYIGANSSAEEEEEIILLPGILLLYLGKRTGDRGIKYKGSQNKIDVYIFECVKYDEDRFAISPSPIENRTPRFPFQPQDRKVDKNRLSLFNLTNMYNKYIPPKNDNLLRLMTWNLHEWRDRDSNYNKDAIIEKISDLNPDILALQEVTGEETGYSCIADMGSYGERLRNDLLVKKGLDVFLQTSVPLGHERCMVVVGINLGKELGKEKLIVGNLHLDVSSAKNRLENITKAISEIESLANKNDVSNIIVLGDFNSYRKGDYNKSSLRDLENVKRGYYNSEEMKRIFETIRYMEDLGYNDTFHTLDVLHPANTNVYGGRIDFIFLSPSFNMDLIGAYSYYSDLSDHIAIIADIDLEPLGVKTPNADIFNGENKYENLKNLKNIKDEDLLKLCLNDPKYKELCRDDNFWKKRLIEKYGEDVAEMKMIKYRDKARSWKDFYLGIVYYVSKNGINRESIKKSYESGLWDITNYLAYEFYWKKSGDKDMLLQIASLTLDYSKIKEYLREDGVDPMYGLWGAIEGKHETLIDYFLNDTKIERWYTPFVSAAKMGDNKTLQKIYEKMLLTGKKEVLHDALHHGYIDALTKKHFETVALIKKLMEDNGIVSDI